MSELNLILLGPPGAGKGTQAAVLTEHLGLPHIATGDILRAAREAGTELGLLAKKYMDAGELVPDSVVIGVILERLGDDDARDGFLLDGFPRTIEQADALASELEAGGRRLTAVLLIDAPDELVVKRISGRRICRKEGHVYHVEFDPPNNPDRCDIDGSELDQRPAGEQVQEAEDPRAAQRRVVLDRRDVHARDVQVRTQPVEQQDQRSEADLPPNVSDSQRGEDRVDHRRRPGGSV